MSVEEEIKKAEQKTPDENPPYRPFYKTESLGDMLSAAKDHRKIDPYEAAKKKELPDAHAWYARGKRVKHIPTQKKVTIVSHEGVGQSRELEFMVVSDKGKKWRAKLSDLRPLS